MSDSDSDYCSPENRELERQITQAFPDTYKTVLEPLFLDGVCDHLSTTHIVFDYQANTEGI
jgi:hypothetical protein